jgi:hypothetical protein
MHSPRVDKRPGTYPLRLYRGDSYAWQIRGWTDPEHTSPIDLAGVTPRAEIRGPAGTIELGATLTEPNVIDLELAAGWWSEIGSPARWDLELTYPDGRVYTVLAGSVTIDGDVTR